jgi:enterochelin esterase-like enzyme
MSRFRTTEISNPEFESDHLRLITVKSPALKGRGDITVFVPPVGEKLKDLPVVVLLHGVYGSHWAWSALGGAHRTALQLIHSGAIPPMVLAMPSDGLWGDGSGYSAHHGADFEAWVAQDVVDAVNELIPSTSPASPLFVSGLSMGGYGALRLGAKFPKQWKAFSGHSSITSIDTMKPFVEEDIAGLDPVPLIDLLLQQRGALPPFRFDCGREDDLAPANALLHRQLEEAGIAHEYAEHPGGHSWDYWREHLKDSLVFFAKHLKG